MLNNKVNISLSIFLSLNVPIDNATENVSMLKAMDTNKILVNSFIFNTMIDVY